MKLSFHFDVDDTNIKINPRRIYDRWLARTTTKAAILVKLEKYISDSNLDNPMKKYRLVRLDGQEDELTKSGATASDVFNGLISDTTDKLWGKREKQAKIMRQRYAERKAQGSSQTANTQDNADADVPDKDEGIDDEASQDNDGFLSQNSESDARTNSNARHGRHNRRSRHERRSKREASQF